MTTVDMETKPPDGGWGWMVVLSSLVCNMLSNGIGFSSGVLLPKVADYFDESKSKVSLMGSVLMGTCMCTGPFASALIKKFGCRTICVTGSFLAAVGFILASFSPNVDVLILTYGVVGGLGFGMVYLTSLVIVGEYFENKRPLATGIAVCGAGVGTFIFSPMTEYLSEMYDLRSLLIIIGGIAFNGVVCGMIFRPLGSITNPVSVSNTNSEINKKDEHNLKQPEAIDFSMNSFRHLLHKLNDIFDFSLLCDIPFILLVVGHVFGAAAYFIPYVYLVDHVISIGTGYRAAAWLMSTIGIMNTIGRILAGALATSSKVNALLLNTIALLVASLALFLLPLVSTYALLMVFCVIYGLCVATYVSLTPIILCDVIGVEKLAPALGYSGFARGVSTVIGPFMAGIIHQMTGSYTASFYTGGAMFFATSALQSCVMLPCLKKNVYSLKH